MRIVSTKHNPGAFNLAMLVLRLGIGILITYHGYQKLSHFSEMQNSFMNFMGLGSKISLALAVFAEFFCGILIILGLLTRFACVPLIITMAVAFFKVANADTFGHGEMALLFLVGALTILLAGPGRMSVDAMISK